MPEMPEVETVLRTLEHQIKDLEITRIKILYGPIINNDYEAFNDLKNEHFRIFERRGKYLLFKLDTVMLVSHLRMEGKYYLLDPDVPIDKHTHVIFSLSNGKELRYHDVRKFGRMEIMPLDTDLKYFHDLGVEPLSEDLNFKYLKDQLKKSGRCIKADLLDQHIIAGIGNIYADEICFYASVDPSSMSAKLKDKTIKKIVEGTKEILSKAIEAGGTTIRSYTSSLGVTGRFQLDCMVHSKKGEPCKVCGTPILKKVCATRGTYYCPYCQKEIR